MPKNPPSITYEVTLSVNDEKVVQHVVGYGTVLHAVNENSPDSVFLILDKDLKTPLYSINFAYLVSCRVESEKHELRVKRSKQVIYIGDEDEEEPQSQ
jgi:hypothetical protein